jgi:hypothetical protein
MEEGYLIIETNEQHPGTVRIHLAETPPAEPGSDARAGPKVRYVARFSDSSAAQMQTHTRLRRRLIDLESGIYRSDPVTAVAAAQSLDLRHHQLYLDPEIAEDETLAKAIARHRWRHGLADRIWQIVGVIAVLFLLLKILLGF